MIVFTPSSNPNDQRQQTNISPQQTRPPSIQPTRPIEPIGNTINHNQNLHHHQHQPAKNELQPSSSIQSTILNQNYPTGLVTILGNTIVNHGLTTELETKVYGTYINGRYAQILKSSSRINEPIAFSSPVYLNPTKVSNHQNLVKPTANPNQDFKQFINSRNEFLKPRRGENSNDETNSSSTNSQSDNRQDEQDKNSSIIKRNRLNRFGNGGRFQYQPRSQPKVSQLIIIMIIIIFVLKIDKMINKNYYSLLNK